MKNSIAIVGRTNVGKSLLFNKLTKSRRSLVIDHHGVTRDINTGELFLGNRSINIEDTGGIPEGADQFSDQILEKVSKAISNSYLVLFVVSAADGLTIQDQEICSMLRKINKKIILLINKTDLTKKSQSTSDFYKLGINDVFLISAKNNIGLNELKLNLTNALVGEEKEDKKIFRRISIFPAHWGHSCFLI
jgi:small GTP-binding protein domain